MRKKRLSPCQFSPCRQSYSLSWQTTQNPWDERKGMSSNLSTQPFLQNTAKFTKTTAACVHGNCKGPTELGRAQMEVQGDGILVSVHCLWEGYTARNNRLVEGKKQQFRQKSACFRFLWLYKCRWQPVGWSLAHLAIHQICTGHSGFCEEINSLSAVQTTGCHGNVTENSQGLTPGFLPFVIAEST